jgi:hypothetical protein
VIAIYEYDPGSGDWHRYLPGLSPFVNNLATLTNGAGYWVVVN